MAIEIDKVPAETRWAIATQGMTGVIMVYVKTLRDIVGEERFNQIHPQIWAEAGKGTKQVADALGLAGSDAKSAAETIASVSIVAMGPEFKFETVEATAEKAVIRATECPWWNRMKEMGYEIDICSLADPAYFNGFAKSLNPKLTVSLPKSMPRGDPYCEWVCELQK